MVVCPACAVYLLFMDFITSQLKEIFGAGTACVVCPVNKILFLDQVETYAFEPYRLSTVMIPLSGKFSRVQNFANCPKSG